MVKEAGSEEAGSREQGAGSKTIAIIPARKGSKRVAGKNMRLLAGKPLLQYAVESARNLPGWPRIFDTIVVTSDWDECLSLAKLLGVEALRRPDELCRDESHDAQFVRHALEHYPGHELFAILRPTSPFRTGATVERALYRFRWELDGRADSMRAVEKTRSHPLKSWLVKGDFMETYPEERAFYAWGLQAFDMGTQQLGEVWWQNGCIHIGHTSNLERFGNVSGRKIAPFFTIGREGVNIDTPEDLEFAEWLMERGKIQDGGH